MHPTHIQQHCSMVEFAAGMPSYGQFSPNGLPHQTKQFLQRGRFARTDMEDVERELVGLDPQLEQQIDDIVDVDVVTSGLRVAVEIQCPPFGGGGESSASSMSSSRTNAAWSAATKSRRRSATAGLILVATW